MSAKNTHDRRSTGAVKDVRPTSSRVLSALFNILCSTINITGCSFLDLFAGTGRVGMTALERGAASVVWVESIRERANAIEKALDKNQSKSLVLSLELRRAVTWLLKHDRRFDIIFADPPYNANWGGELLSIDGLDALLTPDGTFVVEHSIREALIVPSTWQLIDQRDYGETRLSFLRLLQLDDVSDESMMREQLEVLSPE